ncbi:hypothetical protein ACN28I_39435 [Archangium gephyra]|uniref:hypothetical protein n=1 Tax=Archangium gephyra TaxID=48 RepID=UPI003B7BD10D
MSYVHVPRKLVPDFIKLLGHGAVHGTSDTGAYFAVNDKAIRNALETYLSSDALTKSLSISRFSGTWSPREFLERLGFDSQRLDALKVQ